MSFNHLLIYLGIFLGLAILAYLISRLMLQNRMLVSKPAAGADLEADQYYYLPGYGLNLNVNASIRVTKDQNNKPVSKQLLTLDVQPEAVLQADTRTLVTLHYISDPFSNDELKITTSPASLLQNISSDAKDRIATIVDLFTEAPRQDLAQMKSIKESVNIGFTEEIIQVTKTFKLTPEDIGSGEKTIELVEDVSFRLKNKNFTSAAALPEQYNGIFTRPMCNQTWEMTAPENSIRTVFTCYAPDLSRVIKVPVRRAYFSRRQQLPGFSNGILVQNQISKDSEMEGLASIPLNILKAIFSIPAQLLQFKVIHENKKDKKNN